MTVRDFINAFLGSFNFVTVLDYIGDVNAIGADLEEDYGEIGTYPDMRVIPESVLSRMVEYFNIEDSNIIIYLETV